MSTIKDAKEGHKFPLFLHAPSRLYNGNGLLNKDPRYSDTLIDEICYLSSRLPIIQRSFFLSIELSDMGFGPMERVSDLNQHRSIIRPRRHLESISETWNFRTEGSFIRYDESPAGFDTFTRNKEM
ncbi:hypothetical protein AVEN_96191-1 [Araneus ventricosus]|uniref:Uncharacterized protein n=1 Tax=Araneus ventricosus TaxID=182803 RepID=A0A4Y2FT56_ARAVE|nr:hypothetical protein AVEN_96191-1 [Araneus ventricosus]